jgi:hypothetical protein
MKATQMQSSTSTRGQDETVGQLLLRLRGAFALESVDDVLDFVGDIHVEAYANPARFVDEFRRTLSEEEEGVYCPGWDFADRIGLLNSENSRVFLRECVETYLDQTEYLLPIMDAFGRTVACVAQGRPISLFLRDAIAVWPTLVTAAQRAESIQFIAYSRNDARQQLLPRGISFSGSGSVSGIDVEHLNESLLVDVGIWGSLILKMLETGFCKESTPVLFLGTRNPNIEGWANAHVTPRVLKGDSVDLLDIMRLVDTVESLLKPFTIISAYDSNDILARLTDPISFACSTAFLWSLYQYGLKQSQMIVRPTVDWIDEFSIGKSAPNAWCVRADLPKSTNGPQLLRDWTFGPLPPRGQCCGYSL